MGRWRLIHNSKESGSAKTPGAFNKGLARRLRESKREEAETRQDFTKHEDCKAHRLGQCCTDQAPVRPSRRARKAA